jgi:hypothetical protein
MIIPWCCHVCSEKFAKYEGDVCARCNKPTCAAHLKLVAYEKKQGPARPEQIACSRCVKPEERSRRFSKSLLSSTGS